MSRRIVKQMGVTFTPRLRSGLVSLATTAFLLVGSPLLAEPADWTAQLRELPANVFPADKAKALAPMLADHARARIRAANLRESKLWRQVANRTDWERYRDPRIQALRKWLGTFSFADLKVQVTNTRVGDGYRIENLVFESRPGLVVTANLYVPKDAPPRMPGIIICPSHHNPKTQGELQDMGMSWARLGCLVLVPDNLGHGERRQHPFMNASTYPEKFRVGRQDYYFRYNTSLQLYAVGESLAGWIVGDLMRCVDVLLARPGIDKERILLLGSVAGGGDPAAVAGALDPRITAVGPFNFGGPQPETIFPLPKNPEDSFNYAGGGSWESTRNLRLSARDGFLPWVIVGAAAPRRLIYAHEFAWDKDHDPVWTRLQKIYGFYGVPDNLSSTHGRGKVTLRPPEATHCNNIGPEHRQGMYPALNRWFGLSGSVEKEYRQRHQPEELLCLTAAVPKPRPMYELAAALGKERSAAARQRLAGLAPEARRQQLRKDWTALLGDVEPKAAPKASVEKPQKLGDAKVERIVLEVEPSIVVPMLLLLPPGKAGAKMPVVVAVCQQGKQAFLAQRADAVAELLRGGCAVCLPDLRGTGETRPGEGRGRQSWATSISASELMLGQTLLGSRLRDLRSVLRYLRGRPELDAGRIALWGDSFAAVNPPDRNLKVPLDAEKLPAQAEPLGGLLALFGLLFEPELRAAYAQRSLLGYQSLLQSQFCYVPHDAVVPGALTVGDLSDVAGALAPRPLRLEGLLDAQNRRVTAGELTKIYQQARLAYRAAKAADRLAVEPALGKPAVWLLAQLK